MPSSIPYPGVYVQEIPSGIRTITGSGTSVTAFVGLALEGPVHQPVAIHSFAEFERTFGGLWYYSGMSYAVRDYFLNGGAEAIVVRTAPLDAEAGVLSLDQTSGDTIALVALTPGTWFGRVYATVDQDVPSTAPGAPFNLTLRKYAQPLSVNPNAVLLKEEVYRNLVSTGSDSNALATAIARRSELVRVVSVTASEPLATVTNAGPDNTMIGNDGTLSTAKVVGTNYSNGKRGIYALERADGFNILCTPPLTRVDGGAAWVDIPNTAWAEIAAYAARRRAVVLVDPPNAWTKANAIANLADLGVPSANAALYFPRLLMTDPLRSNLQGPFAACGAVAGAIARIDAERGVWKAPAGTDAWLAGSNGPAIGLTDADTGQLNPLGVNVIRTLPAAGTVVWGARTMVGADRLASDWKYLSVRRTALYIEESLYRGTQWVIFQPNNASLWAQIRLNVGAFMQQLFTQGAFQGATPAEAYYVKCDSTTTTQNDINQGVVNIVVGFAPLKPAEFVIIRIQQTAGNVAS